MCGTETDTTKVDVHARMAAQMSEIFSDDNRHFTREALKARGINRDPTPNELALHYIANGGAAGFAERTQNQFVPSSSS